jgi:hypothetical protein
MICDICGVKVTKSDVRRQRFGHIDLPFDVEHPLSGVGGQVAAVPVLPAEFRQAPAATDLGEAYEKLVEACQSEKPAEVLEILVSRICELLLPTATFAFEWRLAEAETFIHGMILTKRAEAE